MKKVLIVSYYFPLSATSGSLRPLGFCRYLEEFGWQPRVLTTQFHSVYPTLSLDEHLSRRLPDGLQIHRVSHANPLRRLIHGRDEVRRRFRATFLNGPTEPKKDIGENIQYSERRRHRNILSHVEGASAARTGSAVLKIAPFGRKPDSQQRF